MQPTKWFTAALLALFAATSARADSPLPNDIRGAFAALLHDARDGCSQSEVAGFVVRMPRGAYAIVRWPASGTADEARWDGAWPSGTVAIVHTHPNWMPEPSRVDRATAARARVPVYVVTRLSISRTCGGDAETVVRGEW